MTLFAILKDDRVFYTVNENDISQSICETKKNGEFNPIIKISDFNNRENNELFFDAFWDFDKIKEFFNFDILYLLNIKSIKIELFDPKSLTKLEDNLYLFLKNNNITEKSFIDNFYDYSYDSPVIRGSLVFRIDNLFYRFDNFDLYTTFSSKLFLFIFMIDFYLFNKEKFKNIFNKKYQIFFKFFMSKLNIKEF